MSFPVISKGLMLLVFDAIDTYSDDFSVYNSTLAASNVSGKRAIIPALKASMSFIEQVRKMPKEEREYLKYLEKDGQTERMNMTPDNPKGAW